jgi:hypothetical protein
LQFKNVENPEAILKFLKSKSDFVCTILDASKILSMNHLEWVFIYLLIKAITKAVMLHNTNRNKTYSVNTEILLCLSPSSSLSDAFKSFGLTKKTKNVLAILPSGANLESHIQDISSLVDGDCLEHLDFSTIVDIDALRKVFHALTIDLSSGPQ